MSDDNMGNVLKSVQEQYIQKEYSKAIDGLLAKKENLEPSLFHYNLGTLYIKEGNMGAARYNLEKSKSLGFNNSLVSKNIQFIESQSQVVSLTKSENNIEHFLGRFNDLSTVNVGVFSLLLAIIILIWAAYKKVWLKKSMIFLSLLTLMPFLLRSYGQNVWQEAIILKDIDVLEGPSKIFEPSGTIFSGSKVVISKEHQGWYFIKFPSKYAGWVKRDTLGLL